MCTFLHAADNFSTQSLFKEAICYACGNDHLWQQRRKDTTPKFEWPAVKLTSKEDAEAMRVVKMHVEGTR
jgi:hypothetical protein